MEWNGSVQLDRAAMVNQRESKSVDAHAAGTGIAFRGRSISRENEATK